MKIVEPSAKILDEIDGYDILGKIEFCARTCYQSRDKAGEGTAEKLIASCIKRGHESILEHVSVSVLFVTDRAVHNELVRHRLIAVSCESTRYCKYDEGIEVICPESLTNKIGNVTQDFYDWEYACEQAEWSYKDILKRGGKPQDARAVLPLSLKCEYIVTANLREWRHIFQLRCSPAAHPEMRRVMIPLLKEFRSKIQVVFDDIEPGGTA